MAQGSGLPPSLRATGPAAPGKRGLAHVPWRAHRDHICDAAVEVALVVLDGDGPVLLDPLHGQWAVQLRGGTWVCWPSPFPTAPTAHPLGGLTRNLRQNSSMELISEPWTCRKAALYCTKRREQAAVYLGRGRAQGQHGHAACPTQGHSGEKGWVVSQSWATEGKTFHRVYRRRSWGRGEGGGGEPGLDRRLAGAPRLPHACSWDCAGHASTPIAHGLWVGLSH